MVAQASTATHIGLGIDLEYDDGVDLSCVDGLVTEEELPQTAAYLDHLIVFSAKEAAFKAIYPTLREPLGFRELHVTWVSRGSPLVGYARSGATVVDLAVLVSAPWVVSLAQWRDSR
jgi:4'-phosphopantetheinyl transferase EntD